MRGLFRTSGSPPSRTISPRQNRVRAGRAAPPTWLRLRREPRRAHVALRSTKRPFHSHGRGTTSGSTLGPRVPLVSTGPVLRCSRRLVPGTPPRSSHLAPLTAAAPAPREEICETCAVALASLRQTQARHYGRLP
ncbi:hypothetical protein AAFF_G00388150 [Aldrovandia affinis]|uniref:Uncharacterized protein n=1 Tax=Aldrovandia affinis TaxID=143900 RepID=A0AAD7WLK1_9TELE|nr:hypothetical protein AAFF_G00388150 [Aldrovandia affinis]